MKNHKHEMPADHSHHHDNTEESTVEYLKLAGVIAGITVISTALTVLFGWALESFMANFMAVFFIVFGSFKLVDLPMFAVTYRSYDIIAKQFKAWAYAFPFVELLLGISYLLFQNNLALNLLTIAITGTASIGVLRELRRKSAFRCACLGTFIKLPLSRVSFVEDFGMMIMAVTMIFI